MGYGTNDTGLKRAYRELSEGLKDGMLGKLGNRLVMGTEMDSCGKQSPLGYEYNYLFNVKQLFLFGNHKHRSNLEHTRSLSRGS